MILGQKSAFNTDAAIHLIDKSLYAPSVHCSYYACFQLMKVVINKFCGISYEQIDSNVSANTYSEHSYIKNEILKAIHEYDVNKYRWFKNTLGDLYQYRIDSDYKNIQVYIDKANQALDYSKELIYYMKSNFNI